MENTSWYYVIDGKLVGPYSAKEIKDLYQNKQIHDQTLVWTETMYSWQEISFSPLSQYIQ